MILLRRVEGKSMLPILPAGSVVWVWRFLRPRVGDIVVAKHQHLELIKRVSQVKNGLVYVLGDNPAFSTDSRHFGWLPASSIIGVVRRRSFDDPRY